MTKGRLSCTFVALAISYNSYACGPEYPNILVELRSDALLKLAEPYFREEIEYLPKAAVQLPSQDNPSTNDGWFYDETLERYLSRQEALELEGLDQQQREQLLHMRASVDAQQAYQLGESLPASIRLYTAGAVAFHQQHWALAEDYFLQVLNTPPAADTKVQDRHSWALYSLGRIHKQQIQLMLSDDSNRHYPLERQQQQLQHQLQHHLQQAQRYYQQLIQLLQRQGQDPLSLVSSALGEQAYLALQQRDYQRAISLYATQAQVDSSGNDSLFAVAKQLLLMPDAYLKLQIQSSSQVSELLSIFLYTQYVDPEENDSVALERFVNLLADSTRSSVITRLAALSYRNGDIELTATLLDKADDSALASWLRAKIALYHNDLDSAAAAYARAAKFFAPVELKQRSDSACRLDAEAGVLELQRGEYLNAARLLYLAGHDYWVDLAYIAERVLTTDELLSFVQNELPDLPQNPWPDYQVHESSQTALHNLLARRLVREGRISAALPFFSHNETRLAAAEYDQALHSEGENSWWPGDNSNINLAEQRFAAARIAREHGMEIMGFELWPDYAMYGGYFSLPLDDVQLARQQQAPFTLSADEQQRLSASQPLEQKRYHYRFVAAELAAQAAELVPHNSQAYVASLCFAGKWVDLAQLRVYYQRYLNNGPYVPWGADFGRECPEPDFASAAQRQQLNNEQQLRYLARQLKPYLLTLTGLSITLIIGWLWYRRRLSRSQLKTSADK